MRRHPRLWVLYNNPISAPMPQHPDSQDPLQDSRGPCPSILACGSSTRTMPAHPCLSIHRPASAASSMWVPYRIHPRPRIGSATPSISQDPVQDPCLRIHVSGPISAHPLQDPCLLDPCLRTRYKIHLSISPARPKPPDPCLNIRIRGSSSTRSMSLDPCLSIHICGSPERSVFRDPLQDPCHAPNPQRVSQPLTQQAESTESCTQSKSAPRYNESDLTRRNSAEGWLCKHGTGTAPQRDAKKQSSNNTWTSASQYQCETDLRRGHVSRRRNAFLISREIFLACLLNQSAPAAAPTTTANLQHTSCLPFSAQRGLKKKGAPSKQLQSSRKGTPSKQLQSSQKGRAQQILKLKKGSAQQTISMSKKGHA